MTDSTMDDSPAALAATHRAAFTQSRPWTEAEFGDLLSDRFTYLTGDARAFAVVREVAGEAELLTIATHPDEQRQGHGRKIMQMWMHNAATRGATDAFLEVAQDNLAAQALYSACGFGLVGIRKAYYPRPEAEAADALLMKRELP
ncbi:ribosomal protein S18-alanine N-acetyltransferase [Tritonibacter mobilis]|uniref:ribosomal protein S18-alanine N-acetyltransferase n=1 Tax=Tritonibacter mobilis TaxID=379347 RepID=UPI0033876FDA|nr:ribosomal protein S18-alanine N-acetyltransferase [Tritonibacter mobilis]